MLNNLKNETVVAQTLRENLKDVLGDDLTLIADTIEGETNLHELIESGVKQILFDQALVVGIKAHKDDLGLRQKRIEDRMSAMRAALTSAMQAAELPKQEFAAGTISRKAVPPSVAVDDESEVPAKYWKARDPVIDKTALKADLSHGDSIPGCHMTNGGETISIRVK